MPTINVADETKELFKKEKLRESAKRGESLSEDEMLIILLNFFGGKR